VLGEGLLQQLGSLRRQARELSRRQLGAATRLRQRSELRTELTEASNRTHKLRRAVARRFQRPHRREVAPLGAADADAEANGGFRVGTVAEVVLQLMKDRQRKRPSAALDEDEEEDDDQADEDSDVDNVSRKRLKASYVPGSLRNNQELTTYIESDMKVAVSKRGIEDLLLAYRLAGVSIFRTQAVSEEDRLVGLRFDSSYSGKYHERYYVVFKTSKRKGVHELRVQRHTMPHFVPVETLFGENEMMEFVHKVQLHISALVARREQTRRILRSNPDISLVEDCAAFDEIKLHGKGLGEIEIHIIYKSTLDTVPSEVKLRRPGGLEDAVVDISTIPQPAMGLTLSHIFRECKRIAKKIQTM